MYNVSYKENKVYALNYHGVYEGETKRLHTMTETKQRVSEKKVIELSCDLFGNSLELIIPIFAESIEAAKEQAKKSFEVLKDSI